MVQSMVKGRDTGKIDRDSRRTELAKDEPLFAVLWPDTLEGFPNWTSFVVEHTVYQQVGREKNQCRCG